VPSARSFPWNRRSGRASGHQPLFPQVHQRRVDVPSVPQRDRVEHQAKRSELVFLTFAIALPKFAALPVEDRSAEAVACLNWNPSNQKRPKTKSL
jgi:hypothetical protein